MTFAPAAIDFYVADDNLSTAIDHYETDDNLCSTKAATLRATDNLSTASNPVPRINKAPATTLILARTICLSCDPGTIFRPFPSLPRDILLCPLADIEPIFDPISTFGRLLPSLY